MQEIKLDYTKKVFLLDNQDKIYRCRVSHCHFKDENNKFQDIDTRLSYDALNGGWKHSSASYFPSIPEYSDGIFEFRNKYKGTDFTLKFRPISGHVKGTYFEDNDGQYVLYPGAFGQDIDLKVYSYWAGIKKIVIVNKPPIDLTKDLMFDFEIIESSLANITIKKSDESIFDFKKVSSKLDFTDKVIRLGDGTGDTYFRNALMWDSGGLSEGVKIELVRENNKLFIRKTIPSEFLKKATFPVYTDHPTSYYAGAGDGYSGYQTGIFSNWATAHDAVTGTPAGYTDYTGTTLIVDVEVNSTSLFLIVRGFLPIDTSGIDDGDTITAATLNLYVGSKVNTDNDGGDWINVVQTSQASSTTLSTADYDQCGAISNPTEGATRIDIGSITTSAYNSWTLDATGIGWISKTGYTLLGLREGHDATNVSIAASTGNSISVASSEDTSGTKDPYLDVTIAGGGSSIVFRKTFSGIGTGAGKRQVHGW